MRVSMLYSHVAGVHCQEQICHSESSLIHIRKITKHTTSLSAAKKQARISSSPQNSIKIFNNFCPKISEQSQFIAYLSLFNDIGIEIAQVNSGFLQNPSKHRNK